MNSFKFSLAIILISFLSSKDVFSQPLSFNTKIQPQNLESINIKYDESCLLTATKAPVTVEEIQKPPVILSILDIRLKCSADTHFYLRTPISDEKRTFLGNEICNKAFIEFKPYAQIKLIKLNTIVLPEPLSKDLNFFQSILEVDQRLPSNAKEIVDSILCIMTP